MKSKSLAVAFIAILLYLTLSVAPAMPQAPGWEICDYCDGTGEIETEEVCPECLGSGSVTPTITISGISAWKSDKVYVRAMVENEEDIPTHGTFTATLRAGDTTYETIRDVSLGVRERVSMTFEMDSIPPEYYSKADMTSARVWVSGLPEIVCPTCDGTGLVYVTTKCPVCDGTGFVAVDGGNGGDQNGGLNIPIDITGPAIGVTVVAGVAIAAVVVAKKRKVSEKDLRKLPPQEFQNWVLKKLEGKPPSTGDSRIGIDGYTTGGAPISIKQSDGLGRDVIDKFASAIAQSRAKNGILVAYSFGNDAYTGKVKAKLNYGLEIQMLTVKDLIESKKKPL
jgi:hypothetical protein